MARDRLAAMRVREHGTTYRINTQYWRTGPATGRQRVHREVRIRLNVARYTGLTIAIAHHIPPSNRPMRKILTSPTQAPVVTAVGHQTRMRNKTKTLSTRVAAMRCRMSRTHGPTSQPACNHTQEPAAMTCPHSMRRFVFHVSSDRASALIPR